MDTDLAQILKRYGTQAAVARAFGVTPVSVLKWVRKGVLPPLRRYQWRDLRRATRRKAPRA
jgi:hypothetical protein